jgi:hypothetical protein
LGYRENAHSGSNPRIEDAVRRTRAVLEVFDADLAQLHALLVTPAPATASNFDTRFRRRTDNILMIERLIHALQALAAPADFQLARSSAPLARPDELALDFDDAFRLSSDCPQIELDARQRECLDRLDRFLERRSGPSAADFWTESAIRAGAEWTVVRELAAAALSCLGAPRVLPPPRNEGP